MWIYVPYVGRQMESDFPLGHQLTNNGTETYENLALG